MTIPSLPNIPDDVTPSTRSFLTGVRNAVQQMLGYSGSSANSMVTHAALSTALSTISTSTDPNAIPDSASGLTASGGLDGIFVHWNRSIYTQGGGEAYMQVWAATGAASTFASATHIADIQGTSTFDAAPVGVTRCYWIISVAANAVAQNAPTGGLNGVQATVGTIGTANLGPLIVQAGNLADGSVTAAKVLATSLDATKFASSIEPITLVSATPGIKSTNTVFNTTDGKLYRWNGTAYVATIPTTDLAGTIADAQITGLAASKLAGTISGAQVGAGILDATKFASSIEPVTVVASVPGIKSTNTVFNTTDGKLYRWNGTAYVATIPTTDLAGTIADAQITGLAASKVTGTLTDAQLAAIAAAKVTGTIGTTQIANNAITTPLINAGAVTTSQIAAGTIVAGNIAAGTITGTQIAAGTVAAGNIIAGTITTSQIAASTITGGNIAGLTITAGNIATDTITAGQIAAGAISASELAAGAVVAGKIAAGTIVAGDIAASTITGGNIAGLTITAGNLVANTITAGQIAVGAIGAGQIAAGAITTAKLVVTGRGAALNDDPYTLDGSAWIGGSFTPVTDTTCPAGTRAFEITSYVELTSRVMPIDPNRNYQYRFWIKAVSGTAITYGMVQFFNAAGAVVYLAGGTWGSEGNYNYFGLIGAAAPAGWTEYVISFGPGEVAKIPTGAKTFAIGALLNYSGSTTPVTRVAGLRVFEKAAYDMIVDGSIIASKLAANAIAVGSAAIQNGAIVNAMLGNATITSAKIASVDASTITVNQLTGTQIAANTITAGNLSVTNLSAVSANTGSLTATGNITVGAAGAMMGGQTAYNTGTGFFLGYSGAAYKFSIGNPAGNSMTWDGAALTITAALGSGSSFPSTVTNSSVTINGSGVLSGAGGGAVTLGGLGTTGVVGSGNLCANADFLLSSAGVPTNFNNYNNGAISLSNSVGAAGSGPIGSSAAWSITANAAVISEFGFSLNTAASAFGGWKANTGYVWSFYAKVSVNPSGTNLQATWNFGPATQTWLQNPVLTTSWQRYVVYINFGANAIDPSGFIFLNPKSAPTGTVLSFACMQIEQGDIPSGWSNNNWASVGGTGKPADNATANQSDAITNAAIATKLTNAATNVMATNFFLQTNGYAGGNGIALYDGGLLAKNAGVTKFSIDSAGNATFAGVLTAATGSFLGSVTVGTTPALSGTTMTGSGGIINSAGTFALGNSTTNINFNGLVLTLNGAIVNASNLNLSGFTASTGGALTGSYSTAGARILGSNTVTVSGGKAPYTYLWTLTPTVTLRASVYATSGVNGATVGISGNLDDGAANASARCTCTVMDANGLSTAASFSASIIGTL